MAITRSLSLGKKVYLHESCTIIGTVTIGDDSSIWPQSVLRGDVNTITIGKQTNIQDACICHVAHAGTYNPSGHPLLVGDQVTVGHRVVLHACTIEDQCLIGIGAIILDGAIIESQTLIAAGSVVPPGKRLTGGYLWKGSPVKQARPLTKEEKAFLKYSAEHYVTLKNRYLYP